jgi:hypothetical protein
MIAIALRVRPGARPGAVFAMGLLIALPCMASASAADNPVLRKLLEQKIIEELSSHNSEETAWFDEKSKDREKVFQMNLFGREIDKRVASWTEQSKTWFWLVDPDRTLSIEMREFAIEEGRVRFALSARAKAGFRVWGRIPKLVKGNASGTVWVKFEIEGSAAIGGKGLEKSEITRLDGHFRDLQFTNDLASPLERLVTDALNDRVRDKNKKLRRSVQEAIDRVAI